MTKIEAEVYSNLYVVRGSRATFVPSVPFGNITDGISEPAYDTGPFTIHEGDQYTGTVIRKSKLVVGDPLEFSHKWDTIDLRSGDQAQIGGRLRVNAVVYPSFLPGTQAKLTVSIDGGNNTEITINNEHKDSVTLVSGEGGALPVTAYAEANEAASAGTLPVVTINVETSGRLPSLEVSPRSPSLSVVSSSREWNFWFTSSGIDVHSPVEAEAGFEDNRRSINGTWSPTGSDSRIYRSSLMTPGESRTFYNVPEQYFLGGTLSRGATATIWCPKRDSRVRGNPLLPTTSGIVVFGFNGDGELVMSGAAKPSTAHQSGVEITRSTLRDDDPDKPSDDVHSFAVFSDQLSDTSSYEAAFWSRNFDSRSGSRFAVAFGVTRQLAYNL